MHPNPRFAVKSSTLLQILISTRFSREIVQASFPYLRLHPCTAKSTNGTSAQSADPTVRARTLNLASPSHANFVLLFCGIVHGTNYRSGGGRRVFQAPVELALGEHQLLGLTPLHHSLAYPPPPLSVQRVRVKGVQDTSHHGSPWLCLAVVFGSCVHRR